MTYSDLNFDYKNGKFQHNLNDDYALFAVWKTARPFLKEIREILSENFEVLLETKIIWSEKYFHENASRLYEVPLNSEITENTWDSGHAKKIGDTSFYLFVIKDSSPNYSYAQSVSKKIELSNLNVVNIKYQIRDIVLEHTGAKYGIHSTNNIYEFFVQGPLLLGVEVFKKLFITPVKLPVIEKDLEGAGGWKNYHELFEVLNVSSNYLIQRSYETLPDVNEDKDIDFLTDSYQRFASILGMNQYAQKPYKGSLIVEKEEISIDIRFVGDEYYPGKWQQRMLDRKKMKNNVFVPREDDYFFSLLFHCKVQKPEVKDKYYGILEKLASGLNFQWFKREDLDNNKSSAELLRGYFLSEDYFYTDPIDSGVYKNDNIIKYLPKNGSTTIKPTWKMRLKKKIVRLLPEKVIVSIKKILN